jgi:hypothetical protein
VLVVVFGLNLIEITIITAGCVILMLVVVVLLAKDLGFRLLLWGLVYESNVLKL